MLVAYLNNPSEKTTGGIELKSNMKQWNFKMKKICSAKHLKPWLMNSTDQQQSVHNWETCQKKAICIISYSILSTNTDIVKIFCVLQNKVALLTRDVLRGGTRNCLQRIFRKVLPNHIHLENIDQKINFYDSRETEIRLPFYRSFSTF